jgi:HD-like signal output (HDOD) protein
MIAEKWNFPDALIYAIRYHHDPLSAPAQYRDVVYTVYLATALSDSRDMPRSFDEYEPKVLREYRITSFDQLKRIEERLYSAFLRETRS